MPSLLVAHHRPGFYFRVLEEGEVEAGDAITKVAAGPERMTIADVDGLLYLPGKTHERLERALRIPALSEGWKGSFRELLAAPPVAPRAGLGGLRARCASPACAARARAWCRSRSRPRRRCRPAPI